jgi:Zinc knuckle
MQCFKCLEVGHLARKCPSTGSGRPANGPLDNTSRPQSTGSGSSGASRDPPVEAQPIRSATAGEERRSSAGPPSARDAGSRRGRGETAGGGRSGPARELYVPANEEPEEELYRHGVSSGINFSRYEFIEVNMTGADVLGKVNTFEEANLHSLVMRNIRKSNYSCPTPVQKHAIPNIKVITIG